MSLLSLVGAEESQGAELSECGKYRYRLWRVWDKSLPLVLWVMLNPSTADGEEDDNTVRRVRSFSKAHGYGGFYIGNLYAWRDKSPGALWAAATNGKDVVGSKCDWMLRRMSGRCAAIVAGWGDHALTHHATSPPVHNREAFLRSLLPEGQPDLLCVGVNNSGSPKHPLYVPSAAKLEPLERCRAMRALQLAR